MVIHIWFSGTQTQRGHLAMKNTIHSYTNHTAYTDLRKSLLCRVLLQNVPSYIETELQIRHEHHGHQKG